MRVTVLRMLTTNTLQAFSGAATTSPLNRASGTSPVRLATARPEPAARQAPVQAAPLTGGLPGVPPPRGSLLNLSV